MERIEAFDPGVIRASGAALGTILCAERTGCGVTSGGGRGRIRVALVGVAQGGVDKGSAQRRENRLGNVRQGVPSNQGAPDLAERTGEEAACKVGPGGPMPT